jgi:tetratricopeptide (TPR) repeat protein
LRYVVANAVFAALLCLSGVDGAPGLCYSDKQAADLENKANDASGRGDFKSEEQLTRQALLVRQKQLKKNDPKVICNLEMVAVACREGKKYREAETLYNQALALWRTAPAAVVVTKDHDNIADNREGLAIVYTDAGQYSKAAAIYKEVVARREKTQGPKDGSVAISMRAYAEVLAKLNKISEARALAAQADKIMPNLCGTPALNNGGKPLPPPPMLNLK